MTALFHAFLALLGVFAPALAAGEGFRVEVSDASVPVGGGGAVVVTLVIPPEFHVYREMVEVSVLDGGGVVTGEPTFPVGEMVEDPSAPGTLREQFEGQLQVRVPVKGTGAPGARSVALAVRYQGCRNNLCTMPATEEVTAQVTVLGRQGSAWRAAPLWALLAAPAFAQAPDEEIAVVFTPSAGGTDRVGVHVDLQGEWHLNKMFMGTSLREADDVTLGEMALPQAHPSGSMDDGSYREDFIEDFDLAVPASGPAGKRTVKVEVAYQACKGVQLCRMPTTEIVEVPLELTGAALTAITLPPPEIQAPAVDAATVTKTDGAPTGEELSEFEKAREQGVWALLALCFLAGIGVSFTPCVLPMVPITMGIIGARSAGSKSEALARAATYVAGLAGVYTALGVFAGMTGGMFGAWLQSTWVVVGIAALFLVMGAGMFGFFNLQLPASVAGRLQGGQRKGGGYADAFVIGMVGALVAGPCSGPVVVAILGLITKEAEIGLGAALMATFSLGMGMIFLVTGAASGWLPSRGPWMDVVKKSFGVFLWLGAVYYARSILSDTTLALLTSAVLLFTAVFAWPSPEDGEGYALERLRQLYAIVGGLVGAYLLVGTLVKDGFILPPMSVSAGGGGGGAAVATAKIPWLSDHETAMAQAQASGKPLMIDFTADWCTACHEMEKYTYTDSGVIAAAEGFVPVMIDCTDKADPAVAALLDRYDVRGLPKVVFVKPDGSVVGSTQDYVPADEFLPKMNAALANAGPG